MEVNNNQNLQSSIMVNALHHKLILEGRQFDSVLCNLFLLFLIELNYMGDK